MKANGLFEELTEYQTENVAEIFRLHSTHISAHSSCNFSREWEFTEKSKQIDKFKSVVATAQDVWAGYGLVANPRQATLAHIKPRLP